jgi:AraC-like DNA-binding protein
MRRGSEWLRLGGRRLRLDEDVYLMLGDAATAEFDGAERGAEPLRLDFDMLALAPQGVCDPHADFLPSLQPRTGAVAWHLAQLEQRRTPCHDIDTLWRDEQLALLLGAAIEADRTLRRRESLMAGLKPATRRELLRRVLMASDHIQSHYDLPLTLGDIADAARLSRFHLARLFQRAHGTTLHAHLTHKRLAVALRLIERTELGLDEVAARTGLGTRSSLFRHLRRERGHSASALRARLGSDAQCPISA